jgi:hypothetical protein
VEVCINYVEHTGETKTLCYNTERFKSVKNKIVIHDIIAFDALILVKCEKDTEFHQATEDISNELARYYIEYREVYYREMFDGVESVGEYYVRVFNRDNNDIATGRFRYYTSLFRQGASYLELEIKRQCKLLIEYFGRVYELT